MKVYLIGMGMGSADTVTVGAMQAIQQCDALIGAQRLLDALPQCTCQKLALVRTVDIVQALQHLEREGAQQAGVLMSGDVGFYSGAAALYGKLDAFDVSVLPGVSSLSYFCARLQVPWHDAVLVSAHGRQHDAAGAIQANAKVFCITGGQTKVQDICRDLVERGLGDVPVYVGERLSYDDERIVEGTARQLAQESFADLSVMLACNPHPVQRAFGAPALPDAAFERGSAPMTKQEVRALAVSKLRIAPNHVVWDVGAGTGSVTVEMALAANRGRVFAIERNDEAVELLKRNCAALGAYNVQAVAGEAPAALAGLPAPDRVFIGGSSGNLDAIVQAAVQANPQVRICQAAVTLETLSALLASLNALGVQDADIVQVQVSRAQQAGAYHLMRAQNPVYLVTVDFGAEEVAG